MHDRSQTVLFSQESEKYSGKRLDVDQLLEQFLTENLTKDPGYEQIEQGLMIRLLQYLCQAYVPQLHTDSKEGKEKAFLYELECYIRTNAPTMTVAGADDTSGEADRTAGGI